MVGPRTVVVVRASKGAGAQAVVVGAGKQARAQTLIGWRRL